MSFDHPFRNKPAARHDLHEVVGRLYGERGIRILAHIGDLESAEHQSSSLEDDLVLSKEEQAVEHRLSEEEKLFGEAMTTIHRLDDLEDDGGMEHFNVFKQPAQWRCRVKLLYERKQLQLPTHQILGELAPTEDIGKAMIEAFSGLDTLSWVRRAVTPELMESLTNNIPPTHRQFHLFRQLTELEQKHIDGTLQADDVHQLFVQIFRYIEINPSIRAFHGDIWDRLTIIAKISPEFVLSLIEKSLEDFKLLPSSFIFPDVIKRIATLGLRLGNESFFDFIVHKRAIAENTKSGPNKTTPDASYIALLLEDIRYKTSVKTPADAMFNQVLKYFGKAPNMLFLPEAIDVALLIPNPYRALGDIEKIANRCLREDWAPDCYHRLIEAYQTLRSRDAVKRCNGILAQKVDAPLNPLTEPRSFYHNIPWYISYAKTLVFFKKDPKPVLEKIASAMIDLVRSDMKFPRSVPSDTWPLTTFSDLAHAMITIGDMDPTPLCSVMKEYCSQQTALGALRVNYYESLAIIDIEWATHEVKRLRATPTS